MKTNEFQEGDDIGMMDYAELVSEDREGLFLIATPCENDIVDLSIRSIYVRENRVLGWGVYEGDDPDWVPEAGDGESVGCVRQEDFFNELFLGIPDENPLFNVINEFLEKDVMK